MERGQGAIGFRPEEPRGRLSALTLFGSELLTFGSSVGALRG
jgi:hypothetical protein